MSESEVLPASGITVRPLSKAAGLKSSTVDASRLRQLTEELRELEAKLRLGGGPEKIEKQHKQGKLTARERIELLLDKDSFSQEIGLLVAYDQYLGEDRRPKTEDREKKEDIGGAPGAGVVTTVGVVNGREVVVVANDATVKAGSWWPETIKKTLRAQEIAMRSHVPIIYLVDSAGVNLPYQGGVFPGQYGASRIFYYNSIMRRYLKVPQIAAVMGPCIAGGAYLPALSDIIIMVEGTSFMGLGGANLVKGATGQTIDNETLGGARAHNEISGVAHYRVKNDEECIAKIREFVSELPLPSGSLSWGGHQSHTKKSVGDDAQQALTPLTPSPRAERGSEEPDPDMRGGEQQALTPLTPSPKGERGSEEPDPDMRGGEQQALTPLTPSPRAERGSKQPDEETGGFEPRANRGSKPKTPEEKLYEIIPEDHRQPYNMRELLDCLLDEGHLDEFQADYAKEIITGHARIREIQVGVIANARGMFRDPAGGSPKFGGIIYTESAEKVAYFIETCNRHQTPLVFIQDVSGFMVGAQAEHSGIIRAGARFVEAMATATVPKIVLTVNHASGAGYYAMAGQGFDPDFIFSWPTGRMGVMEGESAVQAVFGSQLEKLKAKGEQPGEKLEAEMEQVRVTYDRDLDAKYAAARGFVDAVIAPEETRDALELALRVSLNYSGPHLGQFVLPATLA